MKALMIISFLAVQITSNSTAVIDSITSALRSGNSNQINEHLGQTVDVTILDFHGFVDKATTAERVKAFFADKSITGYKVIHKGKSKGKESVYTIGELQTNKGTFKVYMFISELDSNYMIQEIKIEE